MARSSSSQQKNELTEVVANVQRALRPVAPPPAFREHLRDNLRLAAEHQLTQRALGSARERRGTAWVWVFSATVIGALLGFIAVELRARRRRITV